MSIDFSKQEILLLAKTKADKWLKEKEAKIYLHPEEKLQLKLEWLKKSVKNADSVLKQGGFI